MRRLYRELFSSSLFLLSIIALMGWSTFMSYQWRLQDLWEQKANQISERLNRSLSDTQLQLQVLAESLGERLLEKNAQEAPLAIPFEPLFKRLNVSEVLLHSAGGTSALYAREKARNPGLWRATVYDFFHTQSPQSGLEITSYGPRVLDIEPVRLGKELYGLEVAINLKGFLENVSRREGVDLAFLVSSDSLEAQHAPEEEIKLWGKNRYKVLAASTPQAATLLSSITFGQICEPTRGLSLSSGQAYAVLTLRDVEYSSSSVPSVGNGTSLVIWTDYSAVVHQLTQEMRQMLVVVSLLIAIFGGAGLFFFIRYRRRVSAHLNHFRDALRISNDSLRQEARARQQIEERLRGIADEMYTAREEDMKLLALLAHQLKLNSSATLGFAEILQDEAKALKDQESLEALKQLGERIFLMAENIEVWSRREALLSSAYIHPQVLKAIVDKALSSMQGMAERKKIDLQASIEENLIVTVDALILEVALKNLLSNALKFSPHGASVKVVARKIPTGVELLVIDAGKGIPHSVMEKLFDADSEKRHRGTDGEEGLGLGLLIVRWACKVQRIDLRVASDEAQGGCRVTLQCPAADAKSRKL